MGGRISKKPPRGTVRLDGHRIRSRAWRRVRAIWIGEQALRGVPIETIADTLNISKRMVQHEMTMATREGWLDEVREKLRTPLTKAPLIYEQIIEASPEELARNAKGWALKREAIKDLATGLGAFRNETQQTKLVGLAAWHAQQGHGQALPAGDEIDGQVVEPERLLEAPQESHDDSSMPPDREDDGV